MKCLVFSLAIFFLLVPQVVAISTDLRATYAPRETMIGEITGGIISTIQREDVRVVRDGHIDIGVQYDIGKLGGQQYIWLIAPANSGNYTLIISDVVALVEGSPEVVDFTHDFSIEGTSAPYSISPGFVITGGDFEVLATVYSGQQTISVDFPEQREVTLYPGTNHIYFSVEDILGVQQTTIGLGNYQIPIRITGESYICGDGRIDGVEVCDGENLGGNDCTTVSGGFTGGTLGCLSGCLAFDKRLCEIEEEAVCDGEHLSLCLNESACADAEGYWYNGSCNKYEEGAECDSEHVGLCETEGTCIDAEGYWYDDGCNELPEAECGNEVVESGEECDGENLTGSDCLDIGFDGGNLTCTDECIYDTSECFVVPPLGPPSFSINPSFIDSAIFVQGDFPVYQFVITNNGKRDIAGMRLEFNPSKFLVEPNRNITIDMNGSREFNLTLKEAWRGRPFKGVIVAQYGDLVEYMLVDISFTEEEGQAATSYSRNSTSGGPSYYCSELAGYACGSGEICDGEVIATIDFSECCVGSCISDDGAGGSSWIGWLIAGIVIIVGAIIFLKFRKTGKSGGKSPLQTSLAKQKSLP
jgi:hypothetical protein